AEVLDAEPSVGVVSLLGLIDGRDGNEPTVPAGLVATTDLIRVLVAAGAERTGRVWCLTRGAVAAVRADVRVSPVQAQVWGLGRNAGLEVGGSWGGLIDLPAVLDERAGSRLAAVLAAGGTEDQVAIRPTGVFGRRLARITGQGGPGWSPRGTVLITGGTGGLGAAVARQLAETGAERLVLTSRRGGVAPDLGVPVEVVAADMGVRADVARVLRVCGDDLTAVVHAAGVDVSGAVVETGAAELARAYAGKVVGADLLDELLGDRVLDAFVLFSSIAGVWGSGGGGPYAAANAHLDALAADRRARGLAGTALAWGPWAEVGMAALGNTREHLGRRGLTALPPAAAVTAIAAAVAGADATQVIVDVDWARFAPAFSFGRRWALLGDLPEAVA
ncbi:beta-ketoacyl reductase, partial [Jidongwangia harbinensis]|uniref:beta-ketoacyl reductase n=1 Tax=Jidongwangia harbinensis TaxID=2878561 RepID=UPI001CD9BECA